MDCDPLPPADICSWWTKQHRNGLLPYLLPFLGPLLILLIILSIGPVLFNTIMASIKQQIEALKVHPIQVHYQRLEMVSQDYEQA